MQIVAGDAQHDDFSPRGASLCALVDIRTYPRRPKRLELAQRRRRSVESLFRRDTALVRRDLTYLLFIPHAKFIVST